MSVEFFEEKDAVDEYIENVSNQEEGKVIPFLEKIGLGTRTAKGIVLAIILIMFAFSLVFFSLGYFNREQENFVERVTNSQYDSR